METKDINIDALVTDGLQVRTALNEDAIAEYAESMSAGAEFPPITVFRDSANLEETLFLADGYHRVAAARLAGKRELAAQIRDGSFGDALAFALSANSTHGLRRTNADKRNALELAWANRLTLFPACTVGNIKRKAGDPTARQLSEICGVSHFTSEKFLQLAKVADSATSPLPEGDETARSAIAPYQNADCNVACNDTMTQCQNTIANRKIDKSINTLSDRFGAAVPERLVPVFRSREFPQFLGDLASIRKRYAAFYEDIGNHLAFAALGQTGLLRLDGIVNAVRACRPYCVCRVCKGKGCASCNRLGFQTKDQYARVPKELRG